MLGFTLFTPTTATPEDEGREEKHFNAPDCRLAVSIANPNTALPEISAVPRFRVEVLGFTMFTPTYYKACHDAFREE
ncbi:MAG: hypothetical protein ACYC2R_13580 [Burkholderiales bacterium]